MGKASSSKKVARAAGTGGGRTSRGARPLGWYLAMGMVVVLGLATIVFSRNERQEVAGARPTVRDHWHTAYGFYNCTKFEPPVPQAPTMGGLHTHAEGLIHIEPQNGQDTGKRATFGRFASGQAGFKLKKGEMTYPGVKRVKDGAKCGGKAARLEAWIWDNEKDDKGRVVPGDPGKVRVRDKMLMTIAFVPSGTKVPKPPSSSKAASGGDDGQGGSPPVSIPGLPPGVTPDGGVVPPGGSPPPEGSTPPASDAPPASTPSSPASEAPPTSAG